ncbi:MAG: hypothetical protein NC217_00965 [Muribaculaceae bacterium]|nr:hypothetical protein [Muribaculaceae bacterium]
MTGNNRHILIADAGGSGTHWCLIDSRGSVIDELKGEAINPSVMSAESVRDAISPVSHMFPGTCDVNFYGAGCVGSGCEVIASSFKQLGYDGPVSVQSDIVGAARSLFGHQSGIVCILGTGANASLYEAKRIISKVPSLGYILGDEGSGAAIGKRFLRYYLRGDINSEVCKHLEAEYDLSINEIYKHVYRAPAANKYLASWTHRIHQFIDDESIRGVVAEEFDLFFQNILLRYDEVRRLPIGFIGSVAYYFEPVLTDVAARYDVHISKIEQDPIQGLINYHKTNKNEKVS